MKRDMALLRLLLLKLEEIDRDGQKIYSLSSEELKFDGYTWAQVAYHYNLAVEAGLVNKGGAGSFGSDVMFRKLTWSGHDFVDAVRDEEIWRKTREGALAAGGFSIELVKDLAKGLIRKNIEKITGVQL